MAFVHVHNFDKSSVAQSWTEASRGDRISPRHVIIQRSGKRNSNFLHQRPAWVFLSPHSLHRTNDLMGIYVNGGYQFFDRE